MGLHFTNRVISLKIPNMGGLFKDRTISIFILLTSVIVISVAIISGCNPPGLTVPHQEKWGIYELDLETEGVKLIYSTPNEIYPSALRLNSQGDRFVFAQAADGSSDADMEICSIDIDGNNLTSLTDNEFMDVYPVWSPDDTQIAFISQRDGNLDIYVMDADGSNITRLYDSGSNDADIDWAGNSIVFTSQFAIWKLTDDSQVLQITDPPEKGQWGDANLPKGDYDPRLSPDSQLVIFERLEDTSQPNGGYNIFVINMDGTGEKRLTDNSYAQGLVSWSNSGERLVYLVAAISGQGKYDIYMMNSDGTENRNITPDYFPADFLCHSPVFSEDDSKIYFIGQWWD